MIHIVVDTADMLFRSDRINLDKNVRFGGALFLSKALPLFSVERLSAATSSCLLLLLVLLLGMQPKDSRIPMDDDDDFKWHRMAGLAGAPHISSSSGAAVIGIKGCI